MIILSAVIIGLIIGFIRRGSLRGFSGISKWPLGLAGVLIQIVLHYSCYFAAGTSFASYLPIVSFIGYILILITLIFNLDDIFAIILAVGVTGNFVVTFVNGGFMPVQATIVNLMPTASVVTSTILAGTNPIYTIIQSPGTLLWFLGDVLPLSFLSNLSVYTGSVPGISAGTIFMFIGLIGWVQGLMARESGVPVKKADHKGVITQNRDAARPQHFESRTEELFFEDELLPENPLDSFFSNDPENSGKTEVIPSLNTQNISGIRNRLGGSALGQTDMGDYDPSSETRVIDTLEDLPDYLAPDTEVEPAMGHDDVLPQGFFTQSFNAQKSIGQKVFTDENTDELNTGKPVPDNTAPAAVQSEPEAETENNNPEEVELTDSIVFDEPKEDLDGDAFEEYFSRPTPRKRYEPEESSQYIVSKAYKEEMARKDRTEEEMQNIWAQVADDQVKLKNSRRRQSRYSTEESNPYLEEKKRQEAAELARKEAEAQEEIREQERKLAEQNYQNTRTEEVVKAASPSEDTVEDVIMTDADRIAAGYEKVSFQISGRDVSFWKKKKD
ncbi:MAG: DUF5317 family protein [Eubacteriaceae bacterium]|jgi:hypothetical protein